MASPTTASTTRKKKQTDAPRCSSRSRGARVFGPARFASSRTARSGETWGEHGMVLEGGKDECGSVRDGMKAGE